MLELASHIAQMLSCTHNNPSFFNEMPSKSANVCSSFHYEISIYEHKFPRCNRV
ncbi:hypothetical protein B0H12DRAFT_1137658 [Mycena haematopus]|nr:hypothetical protein B0H12DRAFT_1137658 [Mycena haematopus]